MTGYLEENPGEKSWVRLQSLFFTMLTIILALLSAFGKPVSLEIFFAVLLAAVTPKVVQKFAEIKTPSSVKSIIPFLFIAGLLLTGCSHTKEVTEVKQRVIHPEVIKDTLEAVLQDTVIIAVEVNKGDTVKMVEFVPDTSLQRKIRELKEEKKLLGQELINLGTFNIDIKPDSIILWDTIRTFQTIEKKIETPLLSKIGLVFLGIILTIIAVVLLKSRKK